MNLNKSKVKRGLWAIMSPVMPAVCAGMFFSAVGAVLSTLSLALLAYALYAALNPSGSYGAYEVLIFLGVLGTASFLLKIAAFQLSHSAAFKLEQILRTKLTEHLARVPLGFIINRGTGAIKKTVLDDVKNLHAFTADSTPFVARSIAAPAASFILLLVIDLRLALAGLAVLGVGFVFMLKVMRDSVELRRQYEESHERINSAVIEFVQAMPVVRTFDDGTSFFRRYADALNGFKRSLSRWIEVTGVPARAGMMILSPLPTLIAVAATGAALVYGGSLSFFHFTAALLISTGMADAVMPLMWLTNFIKRSEAAALRIQDMLEVQPLPESEYYELPADYSVEFENVCFRYESRTDYAIKDVSFFVPQGSVTALIGSSGAGKSTAAKLIPRFWDLCGGKIKIGGADIRNIPTETLTDKVSFVFQDTFLFNCSIAENILIANPKASATDMIDAAKAAQIHDFIMSLPEGYATNTGDRGIRLSGGQKQRITIARAILRNAPIVVLDEATAFADPENEEEIIKALSCLTRNKTVIIIAHRLSTITDADEIIVFDKGEIAEKGTHEQLIKQGGAYSRLWSNYIKAQAWNVRCTDGGENEN